MALNLTNADVTPSTTSRTLIYTAPANTISTIFSGSVTNIDTTNQATHYVTLEYMKSGGTYVSLGTQVAVPFGVSPGMMKQVLQAGQSLWVTADAANVLTVAISVAEKPAS